MITGTNDTACSTMAAPTADVVVGAEKRRRAEPKRLVEAADAARRRHRDADDQQRRHQPRAGKRHRDRRRRERHHPDLARDDASTAPATRRSRASRRVGPAHDGEAFGERAREARDQPRGNRAGRTPLGLQQPARAAARDGRPCTNISASDARRATGAITRPAEANGADRAPNRALLDAPDRTRRDKRASSSSTATRSRMRSTMIVANAAVASGPPAAPADTGRNTSPARAGSTADAAKPMTVARNATQKRVGPSGASRYCQRSARTT